MSIRTRKLIGAVLLLLLVAVWALLAMAFAQFAFSNPNALAAWIFYVVAGMGWIFPAMPLIRWMEGGKKTSVRDAD
jgi:hypothetical protein